MGKNKVYLAIYGGGENSWGLTEYKTAEEALKVVKDGGNYGCKWMILTELEVVVEEF